MTGKQASPVAQVPWEQLVKVGKVDGKKEMDTIHLDSHNESCQDRKVALLLQLLTSPSFMYSSYVRQTKLEVNHSTSARLFIGIIVPRLICSTSFVHVCSPQTIASPNESEQCLLHPDPLALPLRADHTHNAVAPLPVPWGWPPLAPPSRPRPLEPSRSESPSGWPDHSTVWSGVCKTRRSWSNWMTWPFSVSTYSSFRLGLPFSPRGVRGLPSLSR